MDFKEGGSWAQAHPEFFERAGEYYSEGLEPLAPHRDDFTLVSGLNHENATPGPDGGGDHSRATADYLTGVRPKKTGGTDIRNAISVDQFASRQIGHETRLPSLEISTDGARTTGRCDSGYSCAYQFNLSWASPTKPVPAEQDPRAVFERLFGAAGEGSGQRRKLRQSVLDHVRDEARTMGRGLGARDKEKLEQYLTAVRERRVEGAEAEAPTAPPPRARRVGPAPPTAPADPHAGGPVDRINERPFSQTVDRGGSPRPRRRARAGWARRRPPRPRIPRGRPGRPDK